MPSIEDFMGPIKPTSPMKVNVSNFYAVHYLSKINNQNLLLMFVNPKLLKHDSTETFILFVGNERSGSLKKASLLLFEER